MVIILTNESNGKQVKAVGHGLDYMIYRKVEGIEIDGELMTKNGKKFKNEWRFTGLYPSSITSAIYHCMNLLLNDSDDLDTVTVDISKAKHSLDKIVKNKLDQLVIDVKRIYHEGYDDGLHARNEVIK